MFTRGPRICHYQSSVKGLAEEIKRTCDMYWSRDISEYNLIKAVHIWSTSQKSKFYSGDDINPTIKQRIGKKRLSLILDVLESISNKK